MNNDNHNLDANRDPLTGTPGGFGALAVQLAPQ